MQEERLVQMAKQRFERDLHTEAYKSVHADAEHLEALLDMMEIREGKAYLDLGTGNGYVAFELARRFPDVSVTGADITDKAIAENIRIAHEKKLSNIQFTGYQGGELPFGDASFHGIISRYAFHHFPYAELSIAEMSRILEPGGFVLFADPLTDENDTVGFIDRLQALKGDGHVHFYQTGEILALFKKAGFKAEKHFLTQLSFSRTLHPEYMALLDKTPSDVLQCYHLSIQGEHVVITVPVCNVIFRKSA